jgi:hypothetical protein
MDLLFDFSASTPASDFGTVNSMTSVTRLLRFISLPP